MTLFNVYQKLVNYKFFIHFSAQTKWKILTPIIITSVVYVISYSLGLYFNFILTYNYYIKYNEDLKTSEVSLLSVDGNDEDGMPATKSKAKSTLSQFAKMEVKNTKNGIKKMNKSLRFRKSNQPTNTS